MTGHQQDEEEEEEDPTARGPPTAAELEEPQVAVSKRRHSAPHRHRSAPRPFGARRTWLDSAIEAPVSALRSMLPQGLRPAATAQRHGGAPPRRAASQRAGGACAEGRGDLGAGRGEDGRGAGARAPAASEEPEWLADAAGFAPATSSTSPPAGREPSGGAHFLFGARGAADAGGGRGSSGSPRGARGAEPAALSDAESITEADQRRPSCREGESPVAPWSWGARCEDEDDGLDAERHLDSGRRASEARAAAAEAGLRGDPRHADDSPRRRRKVSRRLRRSRSSADGPAEQARVRGQEELLDEPGALAQPRHRGGRRLSGAAAREEGARAPGEAVRDAGACEAAAAAEAPLPAWAARSLDSAAEKARREDYAGAIQACLPVLAGPGPAITLLQELCASWEKAVHQQLQVYINQLEALEERCSGEAASAERGRQDLEWRVLKSDSELRSCMEELRMEKGCSEEWRRQAEEHKRELVHWRRRAEDHERACAVESQLRLDVQRQVHALQQRCQFQDGAARENAALRQQLREAAAHRERAALPDEVARRVAELECGPLRASGREGRAALKKKLLVKWHPDKQPSAEHVSLATHVMQELQNRPEWADAPGARA